MTKAPCGHEAPRPDGCKWCNLAVNGDRRYLRAWWPHLAVPKPKRARDPNKPRLSIADLAGLAGKKRH